MALTTTNANMVLADRSNAKRQSLGIPAGPDGDDPGLLVLESSSSAKAYAQVFLWADSTGVLRYHTSLPTNEDSDGSVLATTAESGLNRNMSNLLATSIPTSLISDTTLTDDLGSSSIYWNNAYVNKLYGNSTASIDGTTAGKFVVTGAVEFGVNGTGADVTFFGDTSSYNAFWDYSADAFRFLDAANLQFGTGASTNGDIQFQYVGGTNILAVTQVASGTGSITYGADGKGIDTTWYVETASSYIKLDQANDKMLFYIAKLDIGNATVTYDFALSTNSLVLSCTDNSGAKLILGTTGTNGLDVTWQTITSGDLVAFDAGSKTVTFTDVTGVFVKNSASYEGLVIPNGTGSASGAVTTGSIYFETDTKYLSVYDGAGWVKTTLAT